MLRDMLVTNKIFVVTACLWRHASASPTGIPSAHVPTGRYSFLAASVIAFQWCVAHGERMSAHVSIHMSSRHVYTHACTHACTHICAYVPTRMSARMSVRRCSSTGVRPRPSSGRQTTSFTLLSMQTCIGGMHRHRRPSCPGQYIVMAIGIADRHAECLCADVSVLVLPAPARSLQWCVARAPTDVCTYNI